MRTTQKGFTLVEVSVGAAVMVIIASAIAGLQYMINQNQILVFDNTIKVEIANGSVTALTREIRTARGGDNGAYTIEAASNQSMTFFSDVDFDGQAEKVRYFLQGTDLTKGVIEPIGYPVTYPSNTEKVRVIAENVRNGALPIFYYYNANWPTNPTGNPLPTPADPDSIKLVRIHVRVNPKANDSQRDYILEAFTQIRTLKNNL